MIVSPDPATRFLAIDIGSNAVRLKTWRLISGLPPSREGFERHPIRLGSSVFSGGELAEPVTDRLIALLRDARTELDAQGPCIMRAVATSALREAANRQTVLARLRDEAGIGVRILSGEEEAHLMALGALARLDRVDRPSLILDIGGGSSEILLTHGSRVRHAQSFPLGAVRLRRSCYPDADPPSADQCRAAERTIEQVLKAEWRLPPLPTDTEAIGLAGTIMTVGRMAHRLAEISDEPVALARDRVESLTETLSTMPGAAIAAAYAIEPDRAEVIFGGALILCAFLRRLELDGLLVLNTGVADGLLEEYLRGLR